MTNMMPYLKKNLTFAVMIPEPVYFFSYNLVADVFGIIGKYYSLSKSFLGFVFFM